MPEPDRQREAFPSTVTIKTSSAIDMFRISQPKLWPLKTKAPARGALDMLVTRA